MILGTYRYMVGTCTYVPKGGEKVVFRYIQVHTPLGVYLCTKRTRGILYVRLDLTFTFHLEGDAYMVEAKVIDGRPTITMILDEDGEVPATLSREVFDVAEYIAQTCYMDECANIDGNDTVH